MYLATGVGIEDINDYTKRASAKTYGGMSGGPVLTTYNGQYYVAGIISGCDWKGDLDYVAFDTNLHNLIISHK